MDTVLKIARLVMLLSVAFACCAVGYEVSRVHPVVAQMSSVLSKSGIELDALDATTKKIDLTIKELQYPILQVGLTSKKEADMLDGWNAEITRTMQDVDAAVRTVNSGTAAMSSEAVKTMQQVTATVANVNPSLDESARVLQSARTDLGDVHALLSDDDITKTLTNTATATEHVSATAGDVQTAVHAYLHPGWKTRVFNWSMSVVHAVGGWF